MKSFKISQEALSFINDAVFASRNRPLSEGEKFVLEGVWLDLTYSEMVEQSKKRGGKEYKLTYLMQSAGPKLFKVLSEAFKVDINKTNIQTLIEQLMNSKHKDKDIQMIGKPVISGDIPDIGVLVGRVKEIQKLSDMVANGKRVIAITGMGGMGKTHLSVQLIKNLEGSFKYTVWRSLRDAIPLDKLLPDLIQILSQQEQEFEPADDDSLKSLLQCLEKQSCLVVLDNVETIFQEGLQDSEYKDGYGNYKKLFEIIGRSSHQGCLLLTSRETPKEIMDMIDSGLPVGLINLKGLTTENIKEILLLKGIHDNTDKKDLEDLTTKYIGNPFALQQVAAIIKNGVFKDVAEFLASKDLVFGRIQNLLDTQFKRLSKEEKDVMFWLSIIPEPVIYLDLQKDIITDINSFSNSLIDTVNSLFMRSLIERIENGITLHSLVLEYVTNVLEEEVYKEIESLILKFGNIGIGEKEHKGIDEEYQLNRIALLKATSKDYIRETQERLIIQSLIKRIRAKFGDSAKESIRKVLENLRELKFFNLRSGYLAGNLINLLIRLGDNLQYLNCSNLVIKQAYFKDVILRDVNFSNCDLSDSSFADKLGKVISLKFSPNGEFIWIGNADNIIEVWRVADGMLISTKSNHQDWVKVFDFSPNGERCASVSKDGVVKIWKVDIKKGTPEFIEDLQENGKVQSIAFTNDNTLVTATDIGDLNVWNLDESKKIYVLGKHSNQTYSPQICHVAYCHQTNTLASTNNEAKAIELWNINSRNSIKIFNLIDNTKTISSLKFSVNGEYIASGSKHGSIYIWDIIDSKLLREILIQKDPIDSIAFIENDTKIVSGSTYASIRIHRIQMEEMDENDALEIVNDNEPRRSITGIDATIDHVTNKWIFATGSDDRVLKIWSQNKNKKYNCIRTIKSFNNQIKSISLNSDNNLLATSCEDSKVRIWNINNLKNVNSLENILIEISSNAWIWSIAFSSDNQYLAGGSGDNLVYLWNRKGELVKTLKGHKDKIFSVAFSNDNKILATGSKDRTICLWNFEDGTLIKTLEGHDKRVWSISFSNDNKILASASYDGSAKLWDVATGVCLHKDLYKEENKSLLVLTTAFHPTEKLLATAGDQANVFVWDYESGELKYTLKAKSTSKIWSLAFSKDGDFIAGGCNDKKIRIWNLQTKKIEKSFDVSTTEPSSIAFMKNGNIVSRAIVDESEIVIVIDWRKGEILGEIKNPRPYEGLNILKAKGLNSSQKKCLKSLGATE